MFKFIKGRGIEDLFHWVLLGVAISFSYIFYSDMLIGLLIAGIVFELLKPSLAIEASKAENKSKQVGFYALLIVIVGLSLLATCSAITNNYHNLINEGTKEIQTSEWNKQEEKEKSIQSEIDRLNKEINSYPTLENYIKDVPKTHSTNRRKMSEQWQQGKDNLNTSLKTANTNLNKVLDGYTGLKQYKTVDTDQKYKSYTKLFQLIGEFLNVNPDYIAITISLVIALLIEFGVLATKTIAVKARLKRLGTYQATFEERLHNYQNNLLEQNFKNLIENKNIFEIEHNNNTGSDNITVEEITQKEDTSSLFPEIKAENKNYIGDKETKVNLKKGSSTFYPDEKKINKDDINIKVGGFMSNYKKPSITDKTIDRQENKQDENINLKPDILTYLEYMYNNLKGDFSPGKRDIKTNTELKYRTIDLIFEQLIQLNIITVEVVKNVKKTRVLKEKNEALSLINKHF